MRVLKFGKSGGVGGLTKESLFYCNRTVIIHLTLLFGMKVNFAAVKADRLLTLLLQ